MPPPIAMKIVLGREPFDCAIATLAMYLDKTYEDVLRAASEVDRKHKAKNGLYIPEMKRTAKLLGVPLKHKRTVNIDEDYGILCLHEHVAILRNGLIIDTDGTVWDAEDYRENELKSDPHFRFLGLLYYD